MGCEREMERSGTASAGRRTSAFCGREGEREAVVPPSPLDEMGDAREDDCLAENSAWYDDAIGIPEDPRESATSSAYDRCVSATPVPDSSNACPTPLPLRRPDEDGGGAVVNVFRGMENNGFQKKKMRAESWPRLTAHSRSHRPSVGSSLGSGPRFRARWKRKRS